MDVGAGVTGVWLVLEGVLVGSAGRSGLLESGLLGTREDGIAVDALVVSPDDAPIAPYRLCLGS